MVAADGFTIPREDIERDWIELTVTCHGDFNMLVDRRKAGLAANRLSEQRIFSSTSQNNPERPKLLLLARTVPRWQRCYLLILHQMPPVGTPTHHCVRDTCGHIAQSTNSCIATSSNRASPFYCPWRR